MKRAAAAGHPLRKRFKEQLDLLLEELREAKSSKNDQRVMWLAKRVLRIDQHCPEAHFLLARALERENDAQSKYHYLKYIGSGEKVHLGGSHYSLANIFDVVDDYPNARYHYLRALETGKSESFWTNIALGDLLKKTKEDPRAYYRKAIAVSVHYLNNGYFDKLTRAVNDALKYCDENRHSIVTKILDDPHASLCFVLKDAYVNWNFLLPCHHRVVDKKYPDIKANLVYHSKLQNFILFQLNKCVIPKDLICIVHDFLYNLDGYDFPLPLNRTDIL